MSETNNQPTIFLDNIGRTIIGKIENETEETLSVENPSLVHIQVNPNTNQLQLQILPLFFREFQLDKAQPTVWNFKKATITTMKDIPLSPQFIAQYQQIFRAPEATPPPADPEVVKLFDE